MASSIPRIQVPPEAWQDLTILFQKGIRVDIETGCTVRSLLLDQWHLPPEVVTERISTLFLNGKPVDDMDEARVRDGAILALSSAMPGLVGAVMRRGGFYAALRSGITYHETTANVDVRNGSITVKLFPMPLPSFPPWNAPRSSNFSWEIPKPSETDYWLWILQTIPLNFLNWRDHAEPTTYRFRGSGDTPAVRRALPRAGPETDLHCKLIATCRASQKKAGWN